MDFGFDSKGIEVDTNVENINGGIDLHLFPEQCGEKILPIESYLLLAFIRSEARESHVLKNTAEVNELTRTLGKVRLYSSEELESSEEADLMIIVLSSSERGSFAPPFVGLEISNDAVLGKMVKL